MTDQSPSLVAWMFQSITGGHVFYEGAERPEGAPERAIPLYTHPESPASASTASRAEGEQLRRYLDIVLQSGTPSERTVAQTALKLLATPAPIPAPEGEARKVLAELVALKDLKDAIQCWVRNEDTGEQWPKMPMAEREASSTDYDRRKPLAWAAARAVLATHQAAEGAERGD